MRSRKGEHDLPGGTPVPSRSAACDTKKTSGKRTSRNKALIEAERKLIESEERYRTAVEHSNDGVAITCDHHYIYVNKKLLDIFGYSKPEEVIGKPTLMLVHPDHAEKLKEYAEKRYRGEPAPERYEHKGVRKDGTTIIVEVSAVRTTYLGKSVVLSYLRDVTARRQTEEVFRRSEERFRTLIEKSAEVILLYGKDRKRIYASPTITKILGYTIEETMSMHWSAFVHPEDREIADASRTLALTRPGETAVFVVRVCHKDGNWRWVECTVHNLFDEPGVHALVVNFHDITERKQAEEALRQSEKRFRALVEKSSEAIFLDDRNGKRIYVTPSITRILGSSVEDFLAMDRTDFIHPDDFATVATARSYILANPGESATFTNRVRHKDGSWRWVESTVRNLLDEPGVQALVANIHDITERVVMEEALRESENKFRDLAEKSFVGIYIIQDGVFKYVNARFAEIHGYAVDEIIDKKSSRDLIFLEDLPSTKEKLSAEASANLASLHHEFRIVTKAREIRYTEVYGARTVLQGRPATIGTIIDITERKQMEEALRKSEEKYRNIFQNAVEGIFQTTPEGQMVAANPALARTFGYDSPEALMADAANYSKKSFVNPEDRCTLANLVEASGFAENYELQFFRKDGEKIWVSVNSAAVRDSGGKIRYYEGTVADITKRKLAEEALQESEAKYRNVVDHLIVGFYVIQDNRLRYVNRRLCEMTGYSYEELADKIDPLILIHLEDKAFVAERLKKRMRGELDYVGSTFRGMRKDGQVIVMKGLSNLITYEGRPAVAGTLVDITKEEMLESQLRQVQKMEAVGTLAGGIAHDFNNILTAIMGYGTLLQMKMVETDSLRTYVTQILSSAEKAANLTRNLLTFSRKQAVELKPVKVGQVVKGVERLIKSLLTEDIVLDIISGEPDVVVMADVSQMEQILLNLASNAKDAMPGGGALTIETRKAQADDMFVDGYDHIEFRQYALIAVADTGTGIDETTREKIFEPFFTTKEVGKGTGLGLSIVHGIVEQHRGYIAVNSRPQGGTVFHVYIPTAGASAEEAESVFPVAKGGTETILIAEDDEQVRDLTTEILQSAGYNVVEATDGEDAVRKFVEHGEAVRLILLDVVMPGKNGKEAYEEIRKTNPYIKAIFMSGYTGDMVIGKGISEKEYDLIQKPLSPNELLLRVREAIDR